MRLTDLTAQLRAIQDGLAKQPGLRVSNMVCHVNGDCAIFVDGLPKEMYMGKPAEVIADVMLAIQAKAQDCDELDRINADARPPRTVDYFRLGTEIARDAAARVKAKAEKVFADAEAQEALDMVEARR